MPDLMLMASGQVETVCVWDRGSIQEGILGVSGFGREAYCGNWVCHFE